MPSTITISVQSAVLSDQPITHAYELSDSDALQVLRAYQALFQRVRAQQNPNDTSEVDLHAATLFLMDNMVGTVQQTTRGVQQEIVARAAAAQVPAVQFRAPVNNAAPQSVPVTIEGASIQ